MKIIDIIKNKQTISFEFFPPKSEEQDSMLFDTISKLSPFGPDFVSITYGAGGSTRSRTMGWTKDIYKKHKFTTMMHLTCYGNNPDSILHTCNEMIENNILNVLALRGDKPADGECELHFKHADELVEFIKKNFPQLSVGVAGYPEKHTEANSLEADVNNLKKKLDAGADFIITQLFFDNSLFYTYRDLLVKHGINHPIVAGIMPIINIGQIKRFADMCGVHLPPNMVALMSDAEDVAKIGEDHALEQSLDLLRNGVNGVHYYTLNKFPSTYNILSRMRG